MIIQKDFHTGSWKTKYRYWRGWFLFGFIPIFIKQTGER